MNSAAGTGGVGLGRPRRHSTARSASSPSVAPSSHAWRKRQKSSYTNGDGGACVEIANLGGTRAVRDSKNPTSPALRFPAAQWSAFTTGIRTGEFD